MAQTSALETQSNLYFHTGLNQMTQNICKVCNEHKEPDSFSIGRRVCKQCLRTKQNLYFKTKNGLISRIYGHQRRNARDRQYSLPDYTNDELRKWVNNKPEFHRLYELWKISGYEKKLTPSLDRIDDYKSYTFDNIQITTWAENRSKAHSDRKNGINNKRSKAVDQYSIDGEFIDTYYSANEAGRRIGHRGQNIAACARGEIFSIGNFQWRYKNEETV